MMGTGEMVLEFNKAFEIGFPKTGTTSLGEAFRILGLRVCGWSPEVHYDYTVHGDPGPALEKARDYEAFEDGPWHNLPFELLDEKFPGSKFIYLEREIDGWYESMRAEYTDPRHQWFHQHDKSEWSAIRANKFGRIEDYFRGRVDDLLVMNIVDNGEGWDVLCPFLGLPMQALPFPHMNQRGKNVTDESG